MKSCTVRTAQGIGDIFWVYQKLYLLFDEINFVVLYCNNLNDVQLRAKNFVSGWDKVKSVTYEKVSSNEYHNIISIKYDLNKILNDGVEKFNYCCNKYLEAGTSLYEMDSLPVATDLNIKNIQPEDTPPKYILLYCSGGKDNNSVINGWYWDASKWAELICAFYIKYKINLPLVVIGAKYDEKMSDDIIASVKEKISEIKTKKYIDRPQEEVIWLFKKCECFIGYQSGLNILADNFNVRQLMICFPYLLPMTYTWCKPKHKHTLFFADIFTNQPVSIINNLPNEFMSMKLSNRKTVKIGYGIGDIIASIPYIKALGGEYLYIVNKQPDLPDWHPVNHGGVEMVIPLLHSQGLDGKVIPYNEISTYHYDIDMDARTKNNWDGRLGDIYTWNSLFFGVYPDMTKPFLKIEKVKKEDVIVFARTARFNNSEIDYTFLNTINKKKIFIGTEGEVNYLKQCFPMLTDFEYYPITDFLDAMRLIKSSRLFISNQTSFATISEGIGHYRVLEICPRFPSVIPKTPNARPVIKQQFFEKAILELLELSDKEYEKDEIS